MPRRSASGADSGDNAKNCNLKIGFFGALTGDAANLGINIQNGAKLAIDQYNEKNADCKVTLVSLESVAELARRGEHEGTLDPGRFRMTIEIEGVPAPDPNPPAPSS